MSNFDDKSKGENIRIGWSFANKPTRFTYRVMNNKLTLLSDGEDDVCECHIMVDPQTIVHTDEKI